MATRLTAAIALAFALACTTVGLASAAWAPANANHFDGRSPDTKDAALTAHQGRLAAGPATASQSAISDGRSPDTKDAAAAAAHATPSPVIILGASGFDWTDAGIGAAAGIGLATIAAAALALSRNRRTLAAP
jgi:hypothetical protein